MKHTYLSLLSVFLFLATYGGPVALPRITVTPEAPVLSCTQLLYTIQFDNVGDDTAHNIIIEDTLSQHLDPGTLEVSYSSSAVDISLYSDGVHIIARFSFPAIHLPDTSHHIASGMLAFKINVKPSRTTGVLVLAHAGVYFDRSPVVNTESVSNRIGIGAINGTDHVCIGSNITLLDATPGGTWSVSNATASIVGGIATGRAVGVDTVYYTVTNACETRTASKEITIVTMPYAGTISGSDSVCAGTSVTLTDAVLGGYWSVGDAALATVSATGVVSGRATGSTLVSYSVANLCGIATAVTTVYVLPSPPPITGCVPMCIGAATALASAGAGGVWRSADVSVATIGSSSGTLHAVAPGTPAITYTLPSGCYAIATATVLAGPARFTVTGGGGFCAGGVGSRVRITGTEVGTEYQLFRGSTAMGAPAVGAGSAHDFGFYTAAGTYTVTATNPATGCSNPMLASATIIVHPAPTPYLVTGGGTYCASDSGVHIGISHTDTGISYQLLFASLPVGAPLAGTGAPGHFGLFTVPGSYTVLAANNRTSCTAAMADEALVVALPSVVPSVSIDVSTGSVVCSGDTLHYHAAPVHGGSSPIYTWHVNGALYGVAPPLNYMPSHGDVISITMVSTEICASPDTVASTMTMTVTPSLIPSVTISVHPGTTVTPGEPVLFTATATGGGAAPTYQWVINHIVVPGATNAYFIPAAVTHNDSITCIVTSVGECGNRQSFNSLKMQVNTLGHYALPSNNIALTIYPNPTNGDLHLRANLGADGGHDAQLAIMNAVGQVVFRTGLLVVDGKIAADLSLAGSLPPGRYMATVYTATQPITLPFVVAN